MLFEYYRIQENCALEGEEVCGCLNGGGLFFVSE